jgi:hypothetical protein
MLATICRSWYFESQITCTSASDGWVGFFCSLVDLFQIIPLILGRNSVETLTPFMIKWKLLTTGVTRVTRLFGNCLLGGREMGQYTVLWACMLLFVTESLGFVCYGKATSAAEPERMLSGSQVSSVPCQSG